VAFAGDPEFTGTARFRIQRRLGEGGMGVVYQAYDQERRTVVALKLLRFLEAQHVYRFKNEFRALADLGHRNLVQLGELICEGGQWFFTMDMVDGVDFLSYVRNAAPRSRPDMGRCDTDLDFLRSPTAPEWETPPRTTDRCDEKRLRATLVELARGVSALHAANKVHRDIKPSNVLVTPEGRAVLLDFGLVTSAVRSEHASTEAHVVGTAPYMAPEQAASKPVGPMADWYSVGCILYEALTGQPPFLGRWLDVLLEKQRCDSPPPRLIAPHVPPDLDSLCIALLRRDPRERPTGIQILERLGAKDTHVHAGGSDSLVSSFTQGSTFVGRKRELDLLDAAFGETRDGHAVTLFLHGESGLGKTSLVRQFLETLKKVNSGAVALSGRCYERESVPYKAFDGIVDALSRFLTRLDPVDAALLLPRDASLLCRVFPVLERVAAMRHALPPRYDVQNPHELRARAFATLREVLVRIARMRPLVLFIDDLQWADADSLDLLEEILHFPDPPPLLLLATLRPTSGVKESLSALPRPLSETCLEHVRHVELSPLSLDETRALVSLLLSRDVTSAEESVALEAGGHPLFAQELVRHIGRRAPPSHPGAPPSAVRLEDALWERISSLEESARRLLELIAVAGGPTALEVLAQAAELDLASSARWVSLLRVANLIKTSGQRGGDLVEPYHDRVREAVLAHLDADARREHHRRLAEALLASPKNQDARALVLHLQAAGEPQRAALQAEHAARIASDKLAFDQAATLYETALRLGTYSPADTRRLQIQLGDALVNAGRGAAAADLYLQAAEGANAATRLECQRRAALHLLTSGHVERGLGSLGAVLAEVGVKLPATPRRALVSLLWQRARLRLVGLKWHRTQESQCDPDDLSRLDVYRSVSTGLAMVDNIRGADFQARSMLLALRVGEPTRVGRALAMEAIYLGSQGGRILERCRKLVAEARRVAETTSDPLLDGWIAGASGFIGYFDGDFPAAVELLDAAAIIFRERTTGTSWELNNVRLFQLACLRHLGAFRDLSRAVGEYLRDATRRGDRYAETTLTRMFNLVWLLGDTPTEARHELEARPWTPPEQGYHMQHWYDLRARSELALYDGEGHLAHQRFAAAWHALDHSLLLRAQVVRAEACWLRGRLALAEADAGLGKRQALDVALRMAHKLSAERVGYARVFSVLLAAGCAHGQDDRAKCVALLKDAGALATAYHMLACSAATQRRLGDLLMGAEGQALCEEADTWMGREGIRNPARILDVFAPGFSRGSSS
jgi:serine/threonine protein kinase/tetratricopeptide (TPR) repeat protein